MIASSGLDIAGRVLPALLVVIGGPLLAYWWVKRSRVGVTRSLRIAAKAPFGRNTWVAIVETGDQRFLVGAGDHGVNLISELEFDPEAEASEDAEGVGLLTRSLRDTDTTRPRMGLVRRLQQWTLRTAAPPSRRPGRGVAR